MKKIEDTMSKDEEIKVLERLYDVFQKHPNNYLNTLFSFPFVDWAVQRIKDDFPVNAYEYITRYEELSDLSSEVVRQQRLADEREDELEKHIIKLIAQLNNDVVMAQEVHDEHNRLMLAERADSQRKIDVVNQLFECANNETKEVLNYVDELKNTLNDVIQKEESLENEIINLKSKLYDLTICFYEKN